MQNKSLSFLVLFSFGCATKTESDSGWADDSEDALGDENTGSGGTGGDTSAGTDDAGGTGGGTTGGDGTGNDETGGGGDGTEGGGADGGGESDAGSSEIAIAGGYWNTQLSNTYTITSDSITEVNGPPVAATYVWAIVSYDNEARSIIAQNPEGHWAGDGWSRFDWGTDGRTVYLCATVTDADTEATAVAGDFAEWSGDPDTGCPNLVGWMTLTPS